MHKKMMNGGGNLVFSGIAHDIMEVFEISKLNMMFAIKPTLDDVLACFTQVSLQIACPVPYCGGWSLPKPVEIFRSQQAKGWQTTCLICKSEMTVGAVVDREVSAKKAAILQISVPTYEGERIDVDMRDEFYSNKPSLHT